MNKNLLSYVSVAELIARTFPNAEVVLHDLSKPQHSVVYVANNSVTGRKVGQTFHHLIEKAVFAGNPADGVVDNYFFKKEGKQIRSSSLLIRNEAGELIGALCINVDVTAAQQIIDLASGLLQGRAKGENSKSDLSDSACTLPAVSANFEALEKEQSVQHFVNNMVDSMINELNADGKKTKEDRLELIRFMDERGVFLVKGSMEYVAGKLGLSKVTLYGYLDKIHGKR